MTGKVFALLVGIDNYPNQQHKLDGCINDVTAMQEYLQARIDDNGFYLQPPLLLKNQQATRQAVIDGFRQYLCQANKDDVALFYFSGHGSREIIPPQFQQYRPNGLVETLVCWDSRNEGSWDLADKELAKLISVVASNNPHITIILDCCHAGSGTREPNRTAVRQITKDPRPRPVESFIFQPEEFANLTAQTAKVNNSGWSISTTGRHILLAACRYNQLANEYKVAGKTYGAFSYFLLDTLKRATGRLTYRDLFDRTRALVCNHFFTQTPQLEAHLLTDLNQLFLGGAIAVRNSYFTVNYNKTWGWILNAGAVHGIAKPSAEEITELALFPFESESTSTYQLSNAQGRAQVVTVMPQISRVKLIDTMAVKPDDIFKAVVINLPIPPTTVMLNGDEEGVQLIRTALDRIDNSYCRPRYLKAASEDANLFLLARNGQYIITQGNNDRPLTAEITGYTRANAEIVVKYLEHIARWQNILKLNNSGYLIPDNAIRLTFYQGAKEISDTSELQLEYSYQNGYWQKPSFHLKLTNTTSKRLYCALIGLSENFEIIPELIANGGAWLEPKEEIWALDGGEIEMIVPDELWQQGTIERIDWLKLIISSDQFDSSLLQQGTLNSLDHRGLTERVFHSTLNRLIYREKTRAFARAWKTEVYGDWTSSLTTIVTKRPPYLS
ncbi:MAG: caspase family protein [Acidobacteriota bacterium]